MNHRHPQSRHTPHGGSEKNPTEESSFPPPRVCAVCQCVPFARARSLLWLCSICISEGSQGSMPCTRCGSRRKSTRDLWRLSSLSSLSTELLFPTGRSPSLSHSVSLWHTQYHSKTSPPAVSPRGGTSRRGRSVSLSLSLSLSYSLPNVYASFSSRRHSGFRPNPALCHTTARHLALGESPNVGQNRTARQHPGMNGCFGCSDSPPPHCLCQSSARTQGGC